MTSRQRFLKVINGEMPDRVPVTLFMADQGHFINQVYPSVDPWDFEAIQLKIVEIQKQLGVDVFARLLYMDPEKPLYFVYGGLNANQQTENWEVHTENIYNGNTLIKRTLIKTPMGNLTQDFSINEIKKGTFMYACTKKPIESPADLEIAIKYEPPLSEGEKELMKKRVKTIKDAIGEDGIIGAWTPGGPFNNAACLVNHEEMYSMFITDYDYYEKLMNFTGNRILEYTRILDEAGVDVLCSGGNVAGGFMGRKFFEEYVLPFEKKYIDYAQANGTPLMYHNCGEIMNLVESYKKLGCKIVEPFSPAPLGDADLSRVKEIVGSDYVILGGVDHVNYIQKGTKEQIQEVTRKTMLAGKPGGRFILQSADFLEYGTPLENIEAYVKTAMENAGY